MKLLRTGRCLGTVFALSTGVLLAAAPPPPVVTNINAVGNTRNLRFAPYPNAHAYTLLSATNPAGPFLADGSFFQAKYTNYFWMGTNVGWEWRTTNSSAPGKFFMVQVSPMSNDAILTANVLNRLTYGPSPEAIARMKQIGPDAFIAEQLAPWTLQETNQIHTNLAWIEAKMAAADAFVSLTNAGMGDFRAWHLLRAVGANRQLLEILLQFFENHFVTQYDKTRTYFDTYYDGTILDRLAAQLEYLENAKWRAALLNPQCTFHDLLKISAESPAQIIYLDTVGSRGDGSNVANENYARELLELDTFGVDNGYDQNDIVAISKMWTGWRLEQVDFADASNPFALATTNIIPWSTNTSTTVKSNIYGAWAFNYKANLHNNSSKTVFPGKTVPARFGSPWAGTSYQIIENNGTGTNSIQDGYQILAHLANQPFTMEYISIKLCRLLVHDNFPNPTTDATAPEYAYYNYAAGNLTPEAQLVRACMETWRTTSPKGQIWPVIQTITDSELFRSHTGSMQKVKTPLELLASTVRALRLSTNGTGLHGSFTSFTDGYNLTGTDYNTTCPITRMGEMLLFSRETPDGYPESGPNWISAGTLAERLRFIQAFCIAPTASSGGHTDAGNANTACDPVGLLRNQTQSTTWTNAEEVADYFLRLLYPGEGAGNLSLYRQASVAFLNTADNGTSNAFSSLTPSSTVNTTYDNRVRGVVSMLMTMQRFQEQ